MDLYFYWGREGPNDEWIRSLIYLLDNDFLQSFDKLYTKRIHQNICDLGDPNHAIGNLAHYFASQWMPKDQDTYNALLVKGMQYAELVSIIHGRIGKHILCLNKDCDVDFILRLKSLLTEAKLDDLNAKFEILINVWGKREDLIVVQAAFSSFTPLELLASLEGLSSDDNRWKAINSYAGTYWRESVYNNRMAYMQYIHLHLSDSPPVKKYIAHAFVQLLSQLQVIDTLYPPMSALGSEIREEMLQDVPENYGNSRGLVVHNLELMPKPFEYSQNEDDPNIQE